MTLEEAYKITAKMRVQDHRNPTAEEREAKNVIYDEEIVKRYGGYDKVPSHLEPDYMEGWK